MWLFMSHLCLLFSITTHPTYSHNIAVFQAHADDLSVPPSKSHSESIASAPHMPFKRDIKHVHCHNCIWGKHSQDLHSSHESTQSLHRNPRMTLGPILPRNASSNTSRRNPKTTNDSEPGTPKDIESTENPSDKSSSNIFDMTTVISILAGVTMVFLILCAVTGLSMACKSRQKAGKNLSKHAHMVNQTSGSPPEAQMAEPNREREESVEMIFRDESIGASEEVTTGTILQPNNSMESSSLPLPHVKLSIGKATPTRTFTASHPSTPIPGTPVVMTPLPSTFNSPEPSPTPDGLVRYRHDGDSIYDEPLPSEHIAKTVKMRTTQGRRLPSGLRRVVSPNSRRAPPPPPPRIPGVVFVNKTRERS